jgi:hypothetical protein
MQCRKTWPTENKQSHNIANIFFNTTCICFSDHSLFKVNESKTFDNYYFPSLKSNNPYHFITKVKTSLMILFLQYLLEKMKSMLNIPISPLHLGLRPCNRSTLEDENGSYSLDGIPPETTIVSPVI